LRLSAAVSSAGAMRDTRANVAGMPPGPWPEVGTECEGAMPQGGPWKPDGLNGHTSTDDVLSQVYPGLPWSTLVYPGLPWSTLVYPRHKHTPTSHIVTLSVGYELVNRRFPSVSLLIFLSHFNSVGVTLRQP